MNINIPDSLQKLIILIGIISIITGLYVTKELTESYSLKFDKFDKIQDKVTLDSYILKLDKRNLIKKSNELSERYKIKNPIISTDSTMSFTATFSGNKNEIIVSNSLDKIWNNYIKKRNNFEILIKTKEIELKNLNEDETVINSRKKLYYFILSLGILFFLTGVFAWMIDNLTNIENIIIIQTEKVYKYCQSCGQNFSSIRKYGTEKDKTKNLGFCIKCYKNGKFNNSKLTKEEFFAEKKEEIKSYSWLSKKFLMNRFKSLERWNENNYN